MARVDPSALTKKHGSGKLLRSAVRKRVRADNSEDEDPVAKRPIPTGTLLNLCP